MSSKTTRNQNDLTPREQQLVDLILAGKTTAEAAAEMGISFASAATVLSRVYRRLDVSGRQGLAMKLLGEVPPTLVDTGRRRRDPRLSPKVERAVDLLMEGQTNAQIAAELKTSPAYVVRLLSQAYSYFGVENRMQLALKLSALRAAKAEGEPGTEASEGPEGEGDE